MTILEMARKRGLEPDCVVGDDSKFYCYMQGAYDCLRQIEAIYDSETDIVTIITKIHRKIRELRNEPLKGTT